MSERIALCMPNGAISAMLERDNMLPIAEVDDMRAIECPEGITPTDYRYDFASQSFIPIPERPNAYAYFDYAAGEWITNEEYAASDVRARRDALLEETDWTQLPDVPDATKSKWQAYREGLRDVTKQPGFPLEINWPEKP